MSDNIINRTPLPPGLSLIDLPSPRAGFERFITSWYFKDALGQRVLVDVGPACTVPLLFDRLAELTDGVDLILLTHIHLDHSGGLGQVCDRYKDARVLVHPKGVKHLVSPEKLWKASLETLGDVAEMYGKPEPVAPDRFVDAASVQGTSSPIDVIETPGHAPHHLCFAMPLNGEKLFFIGEAAGFYLPVDGKTPYLRPTTPQRFDGAAAMASIRRIELALTGDELLCYAHWGAARQAKDMVETASRQIRLWLDAVSDNPKAAGVVDMMIAADPNLASFPSLPDDLKKRERFFMLNSVKGMADYLTRAGEQAPEGSRTPEGSQTQEGSQTPGAGK
ncbi:MAG: MBL fold metallo-hydrolase [Synergistaceae bacterium]|jgi:glyoxylase-like metal-dependent hydrolase (beta-lactamase superfamily II)|nr:MBL fold metallo-hydrolase [Synergistaceae bacterium]